MENYNKYMHISEDEKDIIRKKILEGIDDMKNGKVIDGNEFLKRINQHLKAN